MRHHKEVSTLEISRLHQFEMNLQMKLLHCHPQTWQWV